MPRKKKYTEKVHRKERQDEHSFTFSPNFSWPLKLSFYESLCVSLFLSPFFSPSGVKKGNKPERERGNICLPTPPSFFLFLFPSLPFPLTALLFRGTSSVFSSTPSSSFLNYYLSLKYSRQDNSHTGCIIMRNPYHLLLSFSEFVEKTCASLLKEGLTRFLFLLLLPYFFFFFVFWFFAGRSQWRSSWTYSTSFSCFSLSHESECPPATSFCQEKREKSTGCYTRKASSGLDLALNFQVICFGFRLQRILVSHVQDSLPLFPVCPSLLEESIEGRENLVFSSSLMSLKL